MFLSERFVTELEKIYFRSVDKYAADKMEHGFGMVLFKSFSQA